MGQVVGRVVKGFRSLRVPELATDLGANHATSYRRGLDTPRKLLNMMQTDEGYLWMPPAATSFVTGVTGTGSSTLYLVRQTFTPAATLIVQRGTTVSLYDLDGGSAPFTTADDTYVLTDDEKIWTLVAEDALYFGNSTETVKVESGAPFTVTDITGTSGLPSGYHSMMYRNRRFVVERVFGTAGGTNERLHYSNIGDPELFGASDFIDIEGYYQGDSWETAIGSPIAAHPFGDVLAVFQSQGVIRFTGTDPDSNFTLRPTMSTVGAWARDTIADAPQGVIFFGGTPRGQFGFYLWSGNTSKMISDDISGYLRTFSEEGQEFSEDIGEAVTWRDSYICALDIGLNSVSDTDNPGIYVYNLRTGAWSTFTGYEAATLGLARKGGDNLCLADQEGSTVYYTTAKMARLPSENAAFSVGYEDEDQPSGLVRFMKVRLTMNVLNQSEDITINCLAKVPGNSTVETAVSVTDGGQVTVDIPLNLRGNSIELDFTIIPGDDADELLVENLELVQSRKNLKVGRVGDSHVASLPSFTVPE